MPTYGPASLTGTPTSPRTSASANVHTATDGRDMLLNDPDGWEVERPWLWWDGPAGTDGSGGPFGNPPPGSLGGPRSYTALPVFMQCTNLIAEQISAMPWQVFREGDKLETPSWIADPMAARLDGRVPTLDVPLVRLSAPEFWAQVITSLLWFGEAFVYTPRNDSGEIMAPLWILHPDDVDLDPNSGRYYVDGAEGPEFLDERDVIVIRGHMKPGAQRGIGVVSLFRDELRLATAVRGFALNTYRSGIPAGYLKVNQPDLTPERARALQTMWMRQHGGTRKRIAVLNSVTEFHPLEVDAQTEALIDMLKITAWEICTMFGVPTSKVGLSLTNSMTYNNAQDDDARFVKDTLRVWVDRIEEALSSRLPGRAMLRVNLDSYLRANTTQRYEAYSRALDSSTGWMTVNEVRALEDLPPLADPSANTRPGMGAPVDPDPEPAEPGPGAAPVEPEPVTTDTDTEGATTP